MSRHHTVDSVSERRLRPIYDWLDNGNNKKALQEADKVLRKQPELQCCRVLKSLALLRLGREEEAETILDKVLSESPTDEGCLQAMTIGYRELRQPEKIALMYEQASKKDPTNEEFLTHLFMSYVRLEEYKKQQITAINLYKIKLKKPYYFWSVMSLVMQALDGDQKIAQTVTLPLAFKMLEKMEKENKLEQEQEALLYLLVLELRADWQGARNLLSGPIGKILDSSASCQSRVIFKRLEVEEKLENWEEVARISRNLIIEKPDQWCTYNSYFTALIHLLKQDGSSGEAPPVEDVLAADQVDRTVDQASHLLRALQTKHPELRGPWLAELELVSRTGGEEVLAAMVPTLLLAYLDRFGSKPTCFSDLKKYISFIPDGCREDFVARLQERCSRKTLSTQGEICSDACAESLLRCCGHHQRLTKEKQEELVELLFDKYEQCQPAVANMETTELRPSDVYLILAGHILWDLWHRHDDLKYFTLAVSLLGHGFQLSRSNWQIKLLLIRFCGAVGGSGFCEKAYTSLDIKHLMLDSLGWIMPRLLSATSLMAEVDRHYCQIVRFYVCTPKETIEHIIQAYKLGNFNQIADMYSLKKRLLHSFNYTLTETERLLLDLVHKTPDHAAAVELVSLPEYSPLSTTVPPTSWDQLRDNRDLVTIVSYDPTDKLLTHQHIQDSFKAEVEFARIRNVLLRCVAASLYLSDDITDPTKSSRSAGLNGEGSTGAGGVLARLVAELEDLLAAASEQFNVPDPPHLPQAPFRPRLSSYLPSQQLVSLLPLFRGILRLHEAATSQQQSEEFSALSIFETIISRIEETQQYLEQEPRLTSSGPSWAGLYRWELATFSVETVALATVLAGAMEVILRHQQQTSTTSSSNSNSKQQQQQHVHHLLPQHQAKSKKKVVLAAFLPAVPSYNQMLQRLDALGDFLLATLEKFGNELVEVWLGQRLACLGLTSSSSCLQEQQTRVTDELAASYRDQLAQMRMLLEKKKRCLQDFQL